MKVVCIKYGTKYSSVYVLRLQSMCARHLPAHDFICMTEDPVPGVECIPLPYPKEFEGWWQKPGLFQVGLFHDSEDVLYLDLDVVIKGSMDWFLERFHRDTTRLWAIDDFSYSLRGHSHNINDAQKRLLGGYGCINSSVMMWRQGYPLSRIHNELTQEVIDEVHGDQNWITKCLWDDGHIALFPKEFAASYKYGGDEHAPIVIFHGTPKPHEVSDQWVIENWR